MQNSTNQSAKNALKKQRGFNQHLKVLCANRKKNRGLNTLRLRTKSARCPRKYKSVSIYGLTARKKTSNGCQNSPRYLDCSRCIGPIIHSDFLNTSPQFVRRVCTNSLYIPRTILNSCFQNRALRTGHRAAVIPLFSRLSTKFRVHYFLSRSRC